MDENIIALAKNAKQAAKTLSCVCAEQKKDFLLSLAGILEEEKTAIFAANKQDILSAQKENTSQAKINRLEISEQVLANMITACKELSAVPDPIGSLSAFEKRPNGLLVGKMRVPLGVIAMIYESRPSVTIDAAILCILAGNAIILRGGSEAFYSNACLTQLLHRALEIAKLPKDAAQSLPTTDRKAISTLLTLDEYVDVVIPRGGEQLVKMVVSEARMPVLKHYKGVCHMFLDESAKLADIENLVINAKTQYPSACNSLECLLVHEKIAAEILPALADSLEKKKVIMRCCGQAKGILAEKASLATEEDFGKEFSDLILAIKIVKNLDAAIDFIAEHGSQHTEAIITENHSNGMRFVKEVDASLVLINASTRFNDGGALGLGAEIGISTSKLHAYGVMGVKELTSEKFIAFGQGQVRA